MRTGLVAGGWINFLQPCEKLAILFFLFSHFSLLLKLSPCPVPFAPRLWRAAVTPSENCASTTRKGKDLQTSTVGFFPAVFTQTMASRTIKKPSGSVLKLLLRRTAGKNHNKRMITDYQLLPIVRIVDSYSAADWCDKHCTRNTATYQVQNTDV